MSVGIRRPLPSKVEIIGRKVNRKEGRKYRQLKKLPCYKMGKI